MLQGRDCVLVFCSHWMWGVCVNDELIGKLFIDKMD